MIIGDKSSFAIEWYSESSELPHWIFGRMCIWIEDNALGDINEPMCPLATALCHLKDVPKEIKTHLNHDFLQLSPSEIFTLLDQKLYLNDEERSASEIAEDSKKYSRYDFLTHGGESFDNYKSFYLARRHSVLFMWTDHKNNFHSGESPMTTVLDIINRWSNWCKNNNS